jgi:hypothetical protein
MAHDSAIISNRFALPKAAIARVQGGSLDALRHLLISAVLLCLAAPTFAQSPLPNRDESRPSHSIRLFGRRRHVRERPLGHVAALKWRQVDYGINLARPGLLWVRLATYR